MIRRVFATVAAALLPVLLAASASAAAPPPSLSGTVTSRIAVQGQITGTPSPGGVRVALYAMPPQPVMVKLIRGREHIQGKLVGVTTSSPTGAYAIPDSHPAAIRLSAFNGVVNLEVWAAGHGYWTVHGMARRIAAGNELAPLDGQATSTPQRANLAMLRLTRAAESMPDTAASDGCWVLIPGVGDLGGVLANLEGLWSTIKGVSKKLSYTTDATTGTGMGLSSDYGNDWTADNANADENSVTDTVGTQRFPALHGRESKVGQTQVEEGLFETCEISADEATFPYAVNGGDYWLGTKVPKATHCVQELPGGGIDMNKTQSYTFSEGINLGAFGFGIKLSSLTGYSHTASISYNFNVKGYACGVSAKPLRGTAHGVVADATVHGNG